MNFITVVVLKLHFLELFFLLVSLSLGNAKFVNFCDERVSLPCVSSKISLEVDLLFMHVSFVLKRVLMQYFVLFLSLLKPFLVAFITFKLADYLCLRVVRANCAIFHFYLV